MAKPELVQKSFHCDKCNSTFTKKVKPGADVIKCLFSYCDGKATSIGRRLL